ncbi:hypothetical protein ABMY26_04295 [Azospirillum sp. HJ39]|uniref:hypothetical protein n=1 Tax=Azospirillum sp. HJ39 TaxID=3159496 RepID=UPI003558A0CD
MSIVNYTAAFKSSNPVEISGTLTASGSDLQVTDLDPPFFLVALTPSGPYMQWVLSAIAWPLAELIVNALEDVYELIFTFENKPISIVSLSTTADLSALTRSSTSIQVSASDLSVSYANGYVTLAGGITLANPPAASS